MQWFYSKNGTQLGPIPEAELRAKVSSGEVAPTDLVWREGMPDWQSASQALGATAAAPSATAETSPAASSSPYPASPANPAGNPTQRIPNYLWQSIFVTILCCWPLGIPAIVFAAKVDGLAAAGDIPGAMAASANAKKWALISFIGWIVALVLYLLFAAFAGVNAGEFTLQP